MLITTEYKWTTAITSNLHVLTVYYQSIVAAVADWMRSNCLQLNVNKTEFMWCTMDRRQHLPTVGPTIGSFSATPASTVRDLGIYIDLDLSMRSHVRWTVSRCFATLPQLCTIRRQVPTTVFQSLATAPVLPHLDYCNSVLYGLPTSLIQRLQSVQHSEHISPALISLHWLRIPERSPSNWQF